MLTIVIADDHAVIRHGLKQIILEKYSDAFIFEASNSNEALRLIKQNLVDVAILDINMPTRDGIETLKDLKQLYPKLPVLILSMHPEGRYAVRALKAGASGYLTKGSSPGELCDAIEKVLRGGKYITPSVAELLADSMEHGEKIPIETLSNREYQVFISLASGKTVVETAGNLALSINTISTYRARILEKMKMKNNVDLTRYAVEHGLLD